MPLATLQCSCLIYSVPLHSAVIHVSPSPFPFGPHSTLTPMLPPTSPCPIHVLYHPPCHPHLPSPHPGGNSSASTLLRLHPHRTNSYSCCHPLPAASFRQARTTLLTPHHNPKPCCLHSGVAYSNTASPFPATTYSQLWPEGHIFP